MDRIPVFTPSLRQLTVLGLAVLLLLGGCKYESVLSEKQGLPLEPALFGVWLEEKAPEQMNKRAPNRIVVFPFNKNEYLIQFNNACFRAWPIRVSGISCLQVEFLGSSDKGPLNKEHKKRFDVWTFETDAGTAIIKALNYDLVSGELVTTGELRRAFHKHRDNPALFTKPMRLRKVPA